MPTITIPNDTFIETGNSIDNIERINIQGTYTLLLDEGLSRQYGERFFRFYYNNTNPNPCIYINGFNTAHMDSLIDNSITIWYYYPDFRTRRYITIAEGDFASTDLW